MRPDPPLRGVAPGISSELACKTESNFVIQVYRFLARTRPELPAVTPGEDATGIAPGKLWLELLEHDESDALRIFVIDACVF